MGLYSCSDRCMEPREGARPLKKDFDDRDLDGFAVRIWAFTILFFAIALAWRSRERRDDRDATRSSPTLRIDANSAPIEVFSALPRLGPSHLRAIDAARKQKPFRSLEEFDLRVKGVGPATIDAIKEHLVFETNKSRFD